MRRPVLTRKLQLEAPRRDADGAGGFTTTWVVLGQVWGDVAARSGRIRRSGGRLPVSQLRYRVTLRATPAGSAARPRPGQRFREGDRLYRILAVAEDDAAARYLVCDTEEETSP